MQSSIRRENVLLYRHPALRTRSGSQLRAHRIRQGRTRASPKCPIDTAVWQACRLDFAGSGVFDRAHAEKISEPRIFPGEVIDSEAVFASGTGKQTFPVWRSNSIEVRKALHESARKLGQRQRTYIARKVDEDVEAGIERKMAERKWRAALHEHELTGSFHSTFSIGELSPSPKCSRTRPDFDLERLADPAEPTYRARADCRRAHRSVLRERRHRSQTGEVCYRPFIFCHAHSGWKYMLEGHGMIRPDNPTNTLRQVKQRHGSP